MSIEPVTPPFYISNDGEDTLAAMLTAAVRRLGQRRLDVAVGYFKPDAWGLIGDAFKDLEAFRLLLGTEPQVEGDPSGLDLADYYQRAIRGELEELVFDRAHASMIDDLIDFLRRESVNVRLYHGQPRENARFLHAKAYVFHTISVVGSSNLTPAGLTTNAELNLVRTDQEAADDLHKWFDSRWTPSMPYKDELIRVLEESKFGDKQWTPYEVFIKALYDYFKDRLGPEEAIPVAGEPLNLAAFQWEGVREATALLDRYRGCIIADATGLGKTFIGLELMRQYFLKLAQRVRRPRFLLVVPAQLKALIWDPAVSDHLGFRVDVVTMESLGRDDFETRRYIEYDFILVDEGHNFRNPATKRYENLLAILGTGKQDKYVVLMTATPINTSVYDMLHQILLLTCNRDDYYAVDGIASLVGYFRRVAKEGAGMLDVIQVSAVRRTRYDIRRRQEQGEKIMIKDEEVRFPEQPPPEPILYDLTASYGGFYEEVVHRIESLRLVPYMDYAAVVGGCASASTPLGAKMAGVVLSGTMPHAMIICFGDTVKAAVAFDEHVEPEVLRIVLVGTFLDEPQEALRVAETLGDKLQAVRLDTPRERGGVTPDLVKEARARLDQAGFPSVKLFISGGITPERMRRFLAAGAPVDGFGVGSYITSAPPNDFTADLKEVEGKPVAKRGRIPGITPNPRLRRLI